MKKNFILFFIFTTLQGLSTEGAACPKPAPTSTKQTIKRKVMVAFTEADAKLKNPLKDLKSDSPEVRQREREATILSEDIPEDIAATP